MRNKLLTTEKKVPESDRGIPIHADEGVHAQMAAMAERFVPLPSRILDVGAGAGAFSLRLADRGYDVTALDVDEDKWRVGHIPFRILNLDGGLLASIDVPYDALCCLEVIEHLENPWQFMRESLGAVRPGGYLLLSTPNVTSFYSRLMFLIHGRFHQFDPADLQYGHINPMTAFEIETAAAYAGWRVVSRIPGGYLPVFDFSALSVRSFVLNVLRGIFFLAARGDKRGWCLLYVLQRP